MSLGSYNTVSVGNTATLIIASNPERKGILIRNNGSQALYIGPDANVTTSNGMPLLPQETNVLVGLDSAYKSAIWGIVASSTLDCRYWEYTE